MKINEVSKYDLVALEFMSGDDQVRAHDIADKVMYIGKALQFAEFIDFDAAWNTVMTEVIA